MGTLFKRANSPYWQGAYMDRTGKRRYRSTGKNKKTEAKDVVNTWELEEKKAKAKAGNMRSELAEVVAVTAVEADKGTLTVDKARKFIMQLYKLANHEDLPNYTVAGWLDAWLEFKSGNLKPKTMLRYESSIKAIKKALGKKGGMRLELFSTQHAKALRSRLAKEKKGARNATVNVKLSDFKAALKAAYDDGLTERNIGSAITLLPEDDSKVVTHFEPREVQVLIDGATRDDFKALILISATTGLRLSDIVEMKWGSVHLAQHKFVITPGKQQRKAVKKTIVVPISEAIIKLLESIGEKNTGNVFPELAGKATSNHSSNFNNLMIRLKVPKRVKLDDGTEASRSFHSLRHSCATWLTNAGVDKDVRKTLMAHSSDRVHEIYAKHDESTLKDTMAKLPRFTV